MRKLVSFVAFVLAGALGAAGFYASMPYWHKDSAPQPAASSPPAVVEPQQAVCSGMVEAVGGEVDVCAQLAGELVEVRAHEGEQVQKGQVVAVLDARRQEAEVAVAAAMAASAEAKLKRVQAGVGAEEKREALLAAESIDSLLKYETANCERLRKLYASRSISLDDLQRSEDQVDHLRKQRDGLREHYESLRRGPLPEEIALARADVTAAEARLRQAQVNCAYRLVTAPMAGTVLRVCRHAGDSLSLEPPTPIVRIVDASRLRIRLEVDEAYVPRLQPPREGSFQVGGVAENVGRLVVTTVIPQFGPKRLFNPDTSARFDTRILDVLCEIKRCSIPLHPGQRITAQVPLKSTSNTGP